MSASNERLMKLIALTKQQREIGPLLQEYVQRKYGVESMADFTKGDIDGVDDKEALYQQWIEWIEAGDLSPFKADEAASEPAKADAAAVSGDVATPDCDENNGQEAESSDASEAKESSDDEPADSDAATDYNYAESEAETSADPSTAAAALSLRDQSPGSGAEAGSVDALILSMIQATLDNQPKPEQSITEDRIREIVRDELRTMLKSLIG